MRIFVTGSADGLGKLAAEALLGQGHDVVVHVRSQKRLAAVESLVAKGAAVVTGDLASLDEARGVAAHVNELDTMDAVIHNAGVYTDTDKKVLTVNVLAPYVLTALMHRPKRLVYLSSGMHRGGTPNLGRLEGGMSYSDSKLFISAFAAALAQRWPDVISSSVDPGWVPTKMGGRSAPDDLRLGHLTQEWLATSDAAAALTSGGYWHHQKRAEPHRSVNDTKFQDELLDALARVTKTALP